ncbi:unnamed protein product [Choristocarpus tenellus]
MVGSVVPRGWSLVMATSSRSAAFIQTSGSSTLGRRAHGLHDVFRRVLRSKVHHMDTRPVTSLTCKQGSTSSAGEDEVKIKSQVHAKAGSESGKGFATRPAATPKPKPKTKKPQKPKNPRSKNLLVIGLGNPGDKYKMTRHNAGFLVAEELARRHGAKLKSKISFQGEYCSISVKGKSIGILRPYTFMNNSGQAARKALDYFKLTADSILVLVDEVALEFGQLRLKAKGSAGGHNGLKSIQAHLKTPEYARLRVGVGGEPASGGKVLADHVLGEFSRFELKGLDEVLADACDTVEHWLEEDDLQKVMTRCNAPR